ncbi:MAG TPA: hypothetical protein VNE82_06430 [Candidatus Binataceae bacterium]|nr:hypothetical protein [Candidatus Binataceae bacterium]
MSGPNEKPAEPKHARSDTGTERPKQIVERIYSDEFLFELHRAFGIEPFTAERAGQIRKLGTRYILGRRMENQTDLLKSDQRNYLELQKATESYLALLREYEERNIGSDMKVAAQQLGWPEPELNDPEGYYRQLLLLLDLLRTATIRQAKYLASRGGRPKNFGLEDLVRHAADFWAVELGRRFTVNYHQGEGITRAFEFIKALVAPLDDISDKQIVTAMRTAIATRRSPGPPKSKRRLTRT